MKVLIVVAAIGGGVTGGIFFTVSTFILPAFARLTPAIGHAAMQSINVSVLTPAFMSVLMVTTAIDPQRRPDMAYGVRNCRNGRTGISFAQSHPSSQCLAFILALVIE